MIAKKCVARPRQATRRLVWTRRWRRARSSPLVRCTCAAWTAPTCCTGARSPSSPSRPPRRRCYTPPVHLSQSVPYPAVVCIHLTQHLTTCADHFPIFSGMQNGTAITNYYPDRCDTAGGSAPFLAWVWQHRTKRCSSASATGLPCRFGKNVHQGIHVVIPMPAPGMQFLVGVVQVWDVLTAYEELPAFVPNLMLCERLPVPSEYAGRVVRLRQVCALRAILRPIHAILLRCQRPECASRVSCSRQEHAVPFANGAQLLSAKFAACTRRRCFIE